MCMQVTVPSFYVRESIKLLTYLTVKKREEALIASLRRVVKYSIRYEIFTSKRGILST
jgi:hypothetical protein